MFFCLSSCSAARPVSLRGSHFLSFQALKSFLQNNGYSFYSDTDTEVIPKLCQYVFDTMVEKIPFSELVMEVRHSRS